MISTLFFPSLKRLRDTLASVVSPQTALTQLEADLQDPDLRVHFWRLLNRGDWLGPLLEAGYFTPKSKPGGRLLSAWELTLALSYVTRVASQVPDEAAKLCSSVELGSPLVIDRLIDIVTQLPSIVAKTLAMRVISEFPREATILDSEKLITMARRLVQSAYVQTGIELSQRLFDVAARGDDERRANKFDEHNFFQAFEPFLRELLLVEPRAAMTMAVETLASAIRAKGYNGDDDDYSIMWRPAIEDHAQNHTYDFAGKLVSPVRDVLVAAIEGGQLQFTEVIDLLERQSYALFRRMRLFIIQRFATENVPMARSAMLDRALFADYHFKHEYSQLVRHRFNILLPREQRIILDWIVDGPQLEIPAGISDAASEQLRRSRARYWQYERLFWLEPWLGGAAQTLYEKMRLQYGIPELADLNVRTTSRFGHETPIDLETLLPLEPAQALARILDWKSDGSRHDQMLAEGLADTFSQLVRTKSEAYSGAADSIKAIPTSFQRAYFTAMKGAIESNATLDISKVLDLAQDVFNNPFVQSGDASSRNADWMLEALVEFLQAYCKTNPSQAFRNQIWQILARLADISSDEPGVLESDVADMRRRDFTTLCLNTPRSRVFHAVFAYALWIAGDVETGPGFQQIPEVKELLEYHLEPLVDSSPAVRAVYGWFFQFLYWFDKAWIGEHARDIFDLSGDRVDAVRLLGWSAWNTFITTSQPYVEFYRLLAEQFSRVVDEATKIEFADDRVPRPLEHLCEHLIVLYARGDLTLEDSDAIIKRLILSTGAPMRTYAMQFAGRSLKSYEGELPEAIADRFMKLWDVYWHGAGKDDIVGNGKAAYGFGYWFSVDAFPDAWVLHRLDMFTEVGTAHLEPDDDVVAKLASIAEVDLAVSLRVLGRFIRQDANGYKFHGWVKPGFEILEKAAASDSASLREGAAALIDILGRRGALELERVWDVATRTTATE